MGERSRTVHLRGLVNEGSNLDGFLSAREDGKAVGRMGKAVGRMEKQ